MTSFWPCPVCRLLLKKRGQLNKTMQTIMRNRIKSKWEKIILHMEICHRDVLILHFSLWIPAFLAKCWRDNYQTLWGRSLFPEILPCWSPCRSRYPRLPAGCCGWLTCCAHLPACWKCTALMAPAAALSCTNKKPAHTSQMSEGTKIRQLTHTWQWRPQNSHCWMIQMYNLSIWGVNWSH